MMKKIAVASDAGKVAMHFGHCAEFLVYEIEAGEIVGSEAMANPGHRPGFLPEFLHELGVNVIISGGMGAGAIDIFNCRNIEVVVGAEGDAQEAAKSYLQGQLKSSGAVCHDHLHKDQCHG